MQARPMLSCGVRPSVTFVNSVKMNKRIFKIFSPSGSHTILVFHSKRYGNIPAQTWSPGLEQSATRGHISAITGHLSQASEDSSVHRVIFEHTTIVTSVSGPGSKSLLRSL